MEIQQDKDDLIRRIIGCAIEAHRELGGPGLLESMYKEVLAFELKEAGLLVAQQKEVPVFYKGQKLLNPLRLDLLVENKIIVEVKSTVETHTIYKAQLLSYLKQTNLDIGLLINFGQTTLIEGLTRVINSKIKM
jgi:GxxExxY protein